MTLSDLHHQLYRLQQVREAILREGDPIPPGLGDRIASVSQRIHESMLSQAVAARTAGPCLVPARVEADVRPGTEKSFVPEDRV